LYRNICRDILYIGDRGQALNTIKFKKEASLLAICKINIPLTHRSILHIVSPTKKKIFTNAIIINNFKEESNVSIN